MDWFLTVILISQKIISRVTQRPAACNRTSRPPRLRLPRRTGSVKDNFRAKINLDVRIRKQRFDCWRQVLAAVMSLVLSIAPVATGLLGSPVAAKARPVSEPGGDPRDASDSGSGGCELNSARGQVRHVIFIQFDNFTFPGITPTSPPISSKCPIF